jgi:methionyl-tRNA formyltransferase
MSGSVQEPFRAVLLGGGSFGIPTFRRILQGDVPGLEVALVVSSPDRPSGRGLRTTATPVSQWAREAGLPLWCTADVNDADSLARIAAVRAQVLVIVSFGQKVGEPLLAGMAAFNLHGSLLPAWRGAAPVQRALMSGERDVGVSVIGIAPRMDAGPVFATASTRVHDAENAGELHDRLAEIGAEPMVQVLRALVDRMRAVPGTSGESAMASLPTTVQEESRATRARKLSRADAFVDLSLRADAVRARINGLAPWPGCDASISSPGSPDVPVKLLRARLAAAGPAHSASDVGRVSARGAVRCGEGEIEVLEAQVPGGKMMRLEDLLRGRRLHASGDIWLRSAPPPAP